ncbi:hypothetical protein [Bdellovibrio sp. HCB2-146]|uniref:hypothetical protein n=1 Tax=Bdellovibrio sp. HCB2-146 TaxID=3394362 RepID=UPI0039BCD50D
MEKFILKLTVLVSFVSLITACAPGEVDDINGINEYAYVQGSFVQRDGNVLRGTGTVRFVETLPGVLSSRSIALKADLTDSINQSSIAVIFNAANPQLPSNDGVMIKFLRSGINVIGTISVNGSTSYMNPSNISTYFPASLDVIIDIHNDSDRVRVFIWRRDSMIYTANTADIDTNSSGDVNPSLPANRGGQGIYMGLQLWNATVTAAQVDLAKVLVQ